MKLLIYSDLHLEFQPNTFEIPDDSHGDVLILAGDIVNFEDMSPLEKIVDKWKKPILYVPGNHEYYSSKYDMDDLQLMARKWLKEYPHVNYLDNKFILIDGVHFFGGTMWTDFNQCNPVDMVHALRRMNDYNYIFKSGSANITPNDTVIFHMEYVKKLKLFQHIKLKKEKAIIISHHAPVINVNSIRNHSVSAAYHSMDMRYHIETIQPDLWIYGHTHEPDDQMVGKTRIVSNPRGYEKKNDKSHLVKGFDPKGLEIGI